MTTQIQYRNTKFSPNIESSIQEDIDHVISGVEAGDSDKYEQAIVNFLVKNENEFTFPALDVANRRVLFWKSLQKIIENSKDVNVTSDVFIVVRIASREKKCLDDLISEDWLKLIGEHIGINSTESKFEPDVLNKIIEAQKALSNILFNSKVAVVLSSKNHILSGILNRVKLYSKTHVSDQIKFFDMKLLFLISALCPEIRLKFRDDLEGLKILFDALEVLLTEAVESVADSDLPPVSLSDEKTNVACETLKAIFNITLTSETDEDLMETYRNAVATLRKYLLVSAETLDKTWQLRNHVVNLLTNMPAKCYSELMIPIDENKMMPKSLVYDGKNMIVIYEILMFLKVKFNDENTLSKQQEIFSPVVMVLLKGAKAHRHIRKYLKHHILPPLKDVKNRPEEGETLRNHLCKLLTTPITQLKDLVAELLFVLCKMNVTRMIKYTGYGNAAGLFAQRGLLGGRRDEGEADFSSEDENSDTEEYNEYKHGINPITGRYEEPHPDPMEHLTEEQKEYEAMKLVQLIDNLTKSDAIKPCRIGPDGKPQPIDHVLQLQEDLQKTKLQEQKDSDSD